LVPNISTPAITKAVPTSCAKKMGSPKK